ncbi:MAG TPA: VCBS repeat-containing protein [Thermoanaerobaculia bacterium]
MKKPWLWLNTSLMSIGLAVSAHAQNPPIVTFSGTTQTALTFNGTDFSAIQCYAPLTWGGMDYFRRGDFDGDGTLDVASLSGQWIYIKTTNGTSDNCTRNLQFDVGATTWGGPGYTWVGDFNGDRKDDIASADGPYIRMKLSKPGAGFTGFTSETWTPGGVWGPAAWTFVGDFNGDGRADIASANGNVVNMKLSASDGRLTNATWLVEPSWGAASYARVGDFDGDGQADIASPDGGTVHMKLSRGDHFDSQDWPAPIAWGGPDYTWVADFNGDGVSDIASANGGTIYMLQSQRSSFAFGSGLDSQVEANWGAGVYTWVIDFDGDGDKDIVSANGTHINVKKNTGLGNFVDASYDFFGTWGGWQYTFALDRSRYH